MYKRPFTSQMLLATCAAAALAIGCGDNTQRSTANRPETGTSGTMSSKEGKPVELTGCVQKSGGSYVLTEMSTPSPAGAPSAKKGDRSVPEREQMNAAQHSYRLTAANDNIDLDKMVGKQVKVSGKTTEPSDISGRDESKSGGSVGTSGSSASTEKPGKREEIDSGDLAKVEATSIEKVSDSCGAKR